MPYPRKNAVCNRKLYYCTLQYKITLLQLAQECFHPARQPVVGGCCALHLGFAKASSVTGLYSVPFTVCCSSWMVLKSTVCWSSSVSPHLATCGGFNSACRQRPGLVYSDSRRSWRWTLNLQPPKTLTTRVFLDVPPPVSRETWKGKDQVLFFPL